MQSALPSTRKHSGTYGAVLGRNQELPRCIPKSKIFRAHGGSCDQHQIFPAGSRNVPYLLSGESEKGSSLRWLGVTKG